MSPNRSIFETSLVGTYVTMVTFVPKKLTRVLIAHFLFSIYAFLPLFHVYPILTPSMGKPAQFLFPQSHLVNEHSNVFFQCPPSWKLSSFSTFIIKSLFDRDSEACFRATRIIWWMAVTKPTSTYTKHVARKNNNYYYSRFQNCKIGLNFFHSFLMQTRVVKFFIRLIIFANE